ncbi:TetR/AcrR family transcriptional regulator C-terminal domain-containing protein [Amorphoplanes nipponensis]|uniref:TetR family transcriptional regulator n=1 Tax=Actinoplanes nipponensis TaxID=135950 RepID=A0A919JP36_9ACTN|nr:TetR/AcrR family transcriptional regulator C-terminal domain-containing protein [Actinoplanes nipponensis]GIE54343.1 TetR family transcriptional regulator [Actinoplanes nipponensis]
MSPRRVPVSRRDRPAKAPLSREGLVAVASAIMREEGLERVTMRRLAAELDTGPASLYVYVRNTAELHGALLDELLAGLPRPGEPTAGRWRDELIDLLYAYTVLLYGYPSLARSVLTLRPSGPRYLRLIDTILGLLHAGGVPVRQAAWGVDLLLQHATATAAEQGSRREAVDAADEEEDLAAAVRAADPGAHPHVGRARDELFSGTGEQRTRWAFASIIQGLSTTAPGS